MNIDKSKEYEGLHNISSTEYFHLNCVGKDDHTGTAFPLLRTKGRKDYHILYIVKGSAVAVKNNKEFHLMPGQLILYKPFEKQNYKFLPNSTSYWIHFSGLIVEETLKRLNLWISPTYTIGVNENVTKLWNDIIYEMTIQSYRYDVICEAKCLELLATISRCATADSEENSFNAQIVYNLINRMRSDMKKDINRIDISAQVGLSVSRIEHIFKETTGMSIKQYHIKLRMNKARYLLKRTDLSISKIAETIGYTDSLYFSKLFKKHVGCSPKKYREMNV